MKNSRKKDKFDRNGKRVDFLYRGSELKIDLDTHRRQAEKMKMQLIPQNCTEEFDDVLKRAVLGHAIGVELQEKYNDFAFTILLSLKIMHWQNWLIFFFSFNFRKLKRKRLISNLDHHLVNGVIKSLRTILSPFTFHA